MEELLISITFYLILVGFGSFGYFLYSYLAHKKPQPKLTPVKVKTKELSTMDKVTQLADDYKKGKVSKSQFEIEKNSILD